MHINILECIYYWKISQSHGIYIQFLSYLISEHILRVLNFISLRGHIYMINFRNILFYIIVHPFPPGIKPKNPK